MGTFTIIRHGQASFSKENYDCLSPLGEEQSRKMGAWWLAMNQTWDVAYVGPKQRHRQTFEAVAAVYKDAGVAFPQPVFMDEFNEHQGASVVRAVLAEENHPNIVNGKLKARTEADKRDYFHRYQQITRKWARGEVEVPEYEAWNAFRDRVSSGIKKVVDKGSHRAVVFSSGGPVAVSAGYAMGLDHETVLEMSWQVRNVARSDFLFSGSRFTQISFNALPHINHPRLSTLI